MTDAASPAAGEPSAGQNPQAYWSLSLYPSAGEGGGCFVPALRSNSVGVRGAAADPARARAEAGRRARTQLRRYCAANGLNKLGTLTYAPPFCRDPYELREHVGGFFRALRAELGGGPLPYVWVPETHKDGERFHVHFAVGQYVRQSLIRSVWGRGHVFIKLIGDLPVGSGVREEARKAAGYLSKYVSKSLGETTRPSGLHRYEVAQGFRPQVVKITGRSSDDVVAQAVERMHGHPRLSWSSAEKEGWLGPPAIWVAW